MRNLILVFAASLISTAAMAAPDIMICKGHVSGKSIEISIRFSEFGEIYRIFEVKSAGKTVAKFEGSEVWYTVEKVDANGKALLTSYRALSPDARVTLLFPEQGSPAFVSVAMNVPSARLVDPGSQFICEF